LLTFKPVKIFGPTRPISAGPDRYLINNFIEANPHDIGSIFFIWPKNGSYLHAVENIINSRETGKGLIQGSHI
jgi:hypothetical protein